MRFDDTNPVKEDQEFVDGILDSVRWLGFDWTHAGPHGAEEIFITPRTTSPRCSASPNI